GGTRNFSPQIWGEQEISPPNLEGTRNFSLKFGGNKKFLPQIWGEQEISPPRFGGSGGHNAQVLTG
ncbi:MAG TPA: hypothetical protein DC064_31560, partial [Cyanobacteria bacterium UBA9273]|nr:hypothetical protein [Cyanobacteria bacterium UBA9273]